MSRNQSWADMESDDEECDSVEQSIMGNDGNDLIEDTLNDIDSAMLASATVRDLQDIYEASLTNAREYRSVYPSHNTLCRYIHEHSQSNTVTTGYLGDDKYIVPLHIPSIIPGHTHSRIAVCYGDATKLGIDVSITSRLVTLQQLTNTKGPKHISGALRTLQNYMIVNDINPPGFAHELEYLTSRNIPDAPITLEHSEFVNQLSLLNPSLTYEDKVYTLPTGCPDTRYR